MVEGMADPMNTVQMRSVQSLVTYHLNNLVSPLFSNHFLEYRFPSVQLGHACVAIHKKRLIECGEGVWQFLWAYYREGAHCPHNLHYKVLISAASKLDRGTILEGRSTPSVKGGYPLARVSAMGTLNSRAHRIRSTAIQGPLSREESHISQGR